MKHKLRKGEQLSVVELDILMKHDVPTLLSPVDETTVESKKIKFQLDGQHQTLADVLDSGLTFGEFTNIILDLVNTFKACESFGMRVGNIELNPELAFVSSNCNTSIELIYWPVVTLEEPASVSEFFEMLGSECAFAEDDHSYVDEYLDIFDTRDEFKLEMFEQSLRHLLQKWSTDHVCQHDSLVTENASRRNIQSIASALPCSTLLRVKTNEITKIDHFPFVVGRSAELCAYTIKGNSFVGRIQFSVQELGGEYFLKDEGSVNATKLEDKTLSNGECVQIHSGEVIEVGDEKFVFFSPDGLNARQAA